MELSGASGVAPATTEKPVPEALGGRTLLHGKTPFSSCESHRHDRDINLNRNGYQTIHYSGAIVANRHRALRCPQVP
jgi:hypothetical protein